MGRPLRRYEPGRHYLVTTRCHQSRFFLRPDRELNEAVLEWLARAQQRFPQLRLLAVCVLPNCLHLVVRDEAGELAGWATYLLGNLARAVNRIRGRTGTFFERRYFAEPILDDESLIDRLVYVVTAPVEAGLCKRASSWRGVVLFAPNEDGEQISVSWVDREQQQPARVRTELRREKAPRDDVFGVEGILIVDPLVPTQPRERDQETVTAAIEGREREISEARRIAGRKTLTMKQVLARSWHSSPGDRSVFRGRHSARSST